jgi:hypothetical protein
LSKDKKDVLLESGHIDHPFGWPYIKISQREKIKRERGGFGLLLKRDEEGENDGKSGKARKNSTYDGKSRKSVLGILENIKKHQS